MINARSSTQPWGTESSQDVARAAGRTRKVGSRARLEEDGLRDDGEFLEFHIPRRADDLFIVGF